ncbi:Molybdenum cofactor guanylyltransferase [hydrothermal vent metagenome]|uniref:Molybdenum cofactor guanylyltransferase n=1 Tax=hydrothermal vent metagenome TaxID=652676 RepID=A0A3B1D256_9ZZZZ
MNAYFFHPYELAFGGYSHSGKTTLITKLIKILSSDYDVAYVKHDIHRFQMDYEHKDTFKAYKNGADSVFISDPKHYAQIHVGGMDKVVQRQAFLDADFALIEGYKRSEIFKIILIDKEEKILEEFKEGKLANVIAFVGDKEGRTDIPEECQYFHWDDLEGIKGCVLDHMYQKAKKIPLHGLVLAGGKSTRMKMDKSLLNYHGKTQVEFCYDLLQNFCKKVFVSNRQEQTQLQGHNRLPQINDTFLNMGPMGGILSALKEFPKTPWLVLACDLPFVTKEVLEILLGKRNLFKYATAYQSDHNAFPEPLCAVYEAKMYNQFLKFLAQGYQCPRKVLINSNIKMIQQIQKKSLDNINHPEEYQEVIEGIKKR